MMKIGTRVLHQKTRNEHKLIAIRDDEGGCVLYTFERLEDGDKVLNYVAESELESTFYFLVEDHPLVQDADRRKSKKNREKVAQPADEEELTALSVLN
jgi:hypothetical protein